MYFVLVDSTATDMDLAAACATLEKPVDQVAR